MGWGSGGREEGKPFPKGCPLPFPQPPEASFLLHQSRQECDEAGEEHQNRHT